MRSELVERVRTSDGRAAGFALHRYYATDQGRNVVDGWLLALPVVGSLLRRIAVARFCRTLGTLAAWGLINLKLGEAGAVADVYVQDTSIEYLAPVWDELVAEASAEPNESWQDFLGMLAAQGKARIRMTAEVSGAEGGLVALRFSARFVAKRRKH